MNKHNQKIVMCVILSLLVVALLGVSYFLGDKHALDNLSIKRITPTQAASAMRGDYFYSDYRENALLVRGTVAASNNSRDNLIVTFITGTGYNAYCNFGSFKATFYPGETITALTIGSLAQRQPTGVMLNQCTIP